MKANGHGPAPLNLSPAQRVALLHRIGMADGWMLLTVAEMLEMRNAIQGMGAEAKRLTDNQAGLIASCIGDQMRAVEALNRMRKFCHDMALRQDLPMVFIQDALAEIVFIDKDLAHFAAHDANETKPKE